MGIQRLYPEGLPIIILLFFVTVEPLRIDFNVRQARHHRQTGLWLPPTNHESFESDGPAIVMHWAAGRCLDVGLNGKRELSQIKAEIDSIATIFTQKPESEQLQTVPFDVSGSAYTLSDENWKTISFNEVKIDGYLACSHVSGYGTNPRAGPFADPDWQEALLPPVNRYEKVKNRNDTRGPDSTSYCSDWSITSAVWAGGLLHQC